MRCPKCGYISFDRQRSCGKCSNDLTAVAEQLRGTVSKAAAPFFLGAVLGKQTPSEEPAPASDFQEEEDYLALDELEAEAPPTDEEDLDFAGTPLDEDDLEEQSLPSLGLEDIDVSDLVPPQEEAKEEEEAEEEEEAPMLPLEDEQKDALSGIAFPGFDADETEAAENVAEPENPLEALDLGGQEAAPQTNEEDDIIDLSSLMDFDEPPAKPAPAEEDRDILELSLGEDEDVLSLDNKTEPTASAAADIPDLGLTLENDDK